MAWPGWKWYEADVPHAEYLFLSYIQERTHSVVLLMGVAILKRPCSFAASRSAVRAVSLFDTVGAEKGNSGHFNSFINLSNTLRGPQAATATRKGAPLIEENGVRETYLRSAKQSPSRTLIPHAGISYQPRGRYLEAPKDDRLLGAS